MSVSLPALSQDIAGPSGAALVVQLNDRLRRIAQALGEGGAQGDRGAVGPAGPSVVLETNGTTNALQTLLNLIAGGNITLTADAFGGVTIAAAGGGGGVNVQTGAYTLVAGDSGKSVVHNSATAHTFTLPTVPPSASWNVRIASLLAGILTVTATANIDGVSGTNALQLCAKQDVYITTDGTNYFTGRAGPLLGTVIITPTSNVAILTLTSTDTSASAQPCLYINHNSGISEAMHIACTRASGSNRGLTIDGAGCGFGISATVIGGVRTYYAFSGTGANGNAFKGTNSDNWTPTISAVNSSTGPDIGFQARIGAYAGLAYASLPSTSAGGNLTTVPFQIVYCTDAKNFVDDAVTVGSVASASGHGAWVCYVNGSWRTMC